ncbi:DUF4198 domain-containing protein [Acinetobacter zhairhuonensis]|uniref:DUF4198 domain-containing protein n=1 Tax=Acinetobacter sp. A7.4 TaxID=2919921 RepID=UPI001F4FA8C0|nr:DUF4198 domain-containing protein [Acinetobacter sp. A7.4]MCJ8161445.1 DUF4198 domain-containing protein [Acinetobacter sp. A7.4]
MKKLIFSSALFFSTYTFAHEPYVAPLAYNTANTQIPVIAAYAEQALQAEYALKDPQFLIIQPNQKQATVKPATTLKSATIFDLSLPEKGTYTVVTTTSYPIQYVQYNKQWKVLANATADQVPPINERDYVIASDFKGKLPKKVDTVREWTLQTYISKETTTAVATTSAPIQIHLQTHPNRIIAQQPVQVQILHAGKPLAHAELVLREQGATEQQAQNINVESNGRASFTFPHAGQYLLEVTEKVDPKAIPKNQYYTIISLNVAQAAS